MRSAWGRASKSATWAIRSRETATIFIAPVIFCVERTLLMRVRWSFKLGIAGFPLHSF
jgi:hypothetical protein